MFEKKICEGKTTMFVRLSTNKYRITTSVENKNIYLKNLLNFTLINIIYQTNLDKFEKIHTEILSENKARIFILTKNLFKSFGLKQRYASYDIEKHDYEDGVKFVLQINPEYGKQLNDCSNAILLPIKEITYDFKLVSPHKVNITQDINFEDGFGILTCLEQIIGYVIKSTIKQSVHFIRNIKL